MAARQAAIDEYMRKKKSNELKPDEVDDELELLDNLSQIDTGDR